MPVSLSCNVLTLGVARRSIACASLVVLALCGPSGHAAGGPQAKRATRQAEVTLNFPNVEVESAARAMSAILDRPMLVDPRVKGQMTLYSEQPVSVTQAFLMFLSGLRGLGFTIVESNGLLKVVPEAEAKLQTSSVAIGSNSRQGDQVITQVFKLSYESANSLVAVLRPLIGANNTINANAGNNTLVITDYASNLNRLGTIISALDTPSATDVEMIPLQHTVAADLAPVVQRLSESAASGLVPAGSAGAAGSLAIMAYSQTNSLLVRAANPARLASVRALIARLDQPGASSSNIHVVYLKFADATRLAQVLRAAATTDANRSSAAGSGGAAGQSPASTSASMSAATSAATSGAGLTPSAGGNTASPQSASPVAAVGQPSIGGFIQADPATNSLIVTAAEPLYRELRAVIDDLDTRRAQLYVESVVVEVDASKALDVGLQWKSIFNITNETTLSLGAVAQAIQSTAGTNILSTANLVTLDNEEAKIVVGQNVPFVTGSYTNTGSSTTNPFQTIERKDVGITLRIRPQIGTNGSVRMVIFQESSSVSSEVATGTSNSGLTTNKRSIESTVVVDDGKIVVLGGLIEDSYSVDRTQIPILGELPVLGSIFRNMSRTRKRTNLVVFLRPVIVRDEAASNKQSLDRYDYIRANQTAVQPNQPETLPAEEGPMLPADPSGPMRPEPPPPPSEVPP